MTVQARPDDIVRQHLPPNLMGNRRSGYRSRRRRICEQQAEPWALPGYSPAAGINLLGSRNIALQQLVFQMPAPLASRDARLERPSHAETCRGSGQQMGGLREAAGGFSPVISTHSGYFRPIAPNPPA